MRTWFARVVRMTLLSLLLGTFLVSLTQPASAAIIVVNTTQDDYNVNTGTCSLREAIQAANTDAAFGGCPAGSGADTIQLEAGPYILDELPTGDDNNVSGDLDVMGDLTINGPALPARAAIDANDIDRVFHLRGGSVVMNRSIVENGTADRGGGITGSGLTFVDGIIRNNMATVSGGGVHGARNTFIRSTIENNVAPTGGGILTAAGSLELVDSRVDSNDATADDGEGGGIFFFDGDLTLTDTAVTFNTNQGTGGGITVRSPVFPSTVTLTRTRVANNSAEDGGGGILLRGGLGGLEASITDSEIASNFGNVDNTGGGNGGGISNFGGVELTVAGTTVSGNTAVDGDGILNAGNATLRNLTISGNGSTGSGGNGGGLWNDTDTTTTLSNVTFNANAASATGGSGGNIYNLDAGLSAKNVLMGSDLAGGHCGATPPVATGQNMEAAGDASPCGFTSVSDVGIGPLQNNGGPKLIDGSAPKTHALLPASPALDQANSGEPTDQRGVPRPQAGGWDLGAYERAFCQGVLVNEVGTEGDDSITAETTDDGILALGGDDLVHALEGNDAVCAGDGNDVVLGGFPGSDADGADVLVGGSGNDDLRGGSAADDLFGGGGGDLLMGQAGADDATGGSGGDDVRGNDGNDDLAGNGGRDKLAGGPGKDDCNGGPGTDSSTGCESKTGIP
jgi:CSLREA domain-containing protein